MLIRISTKVLKSFTGTFHDIKIIVDPFFCRVNEKETTNTTTTDEFPISNKSNNHRGSCASTLNLHTNIRQSLKILINIGTETMETHCKPLCTSHRKDIPTNQKILHFELIDL